MSSFTGHSSCDKCSSSDALATYSDGGTHCFSCGAHNSSDSSKSFTVKTPSELIDYQECFQALPISSRKISQSTCKFYNYLQGFHKGEFVHVASHYDKEGHLCAQKLRYIDKKFPWRGDAKKATLFGQHLFIPNDRLSVTVTEGPLDTLSIAEIQDCKWPVVSLKGGAQGAKKELEEQFEWLNGFKEIRLCFDNDEAGKQAIEDCLSIPFQAGKLKVISLPLKDASDMLQSDKISELQKCLMNAKLYRPDNIINCKDAGIKDYLGDYSQGLDIPYPELNSMIRGVHQRRLIVFTSGWGMGKSTLLKEIGYYLAMKHGKKVGCIFLEESKAETLQSFISIHTDTPLIEQQENPDMATKLFMDNREEVFGKGLLEVYDHSGEHNPETLIQRIEYMVAGLGCEFIIFDHITYLVSGMSGGNEGDRKLIDILLNKLNSIKLRTGAGILTACQLRKNNANQKGINNGGEIELQALKGSGEIAGIVDVAIGIEGDQQDPDQTDIRSIRVLKNRTGGRLGYAGQMFYNTDTGRLLDRGRNIPDIQDDREVSI